jgi:hypothetical protein
MPASGTSHHLEITEGHYESTFGPMSIRLNRFVRSRLPDLAAAARARRQAAFVQSEIEGKRGTCPPSIPR